MIALLFAADLAAAQPAAAPRSRFAVTGLDGAAAWARGACGASPVQKVGGGTAERLRKLGDLPKAHHEIAVLRTEAGCPKPVIVRYNVGR